MEASRGATEGVLRDAVNPSLEAVENTSCFLHPGEHPQSLRSTVIGITVTRLLSLMRL
jgi:hypothetical protein